MLIWTILLACCVLVPALLERVGHVISYHTLNLFNVNARGKTKERLDMDLSILSARNTPTASKYILVGIVSIGD